MLRWLKEILNKGRDNPLTYAEASEAAASIASGESSDIQAAAFLIAERMKGESPESVAAFLEVFRGYSISVKRSPTTICIAGSAESGTYFPLTLAICMMTASVGMSYVVTGTEQRPSGGQLKGSGAVGASGKECAGVWERMLKDTRMVYIDIETYCPPLQHLRAIRGELGIATLLNTVEKMLNPFSSQHALIGVEDANETLRLQPLLTSAGFESGYLVNGLGGTEVLPLDRITQIRKVTVYGDETTYIDPDLFGFGKKQPLALTDQSLMPSLERILQGEEDGELIQLRNYLIFNAGLRLYWFERVNSFEEGFMLAKSLLQRKSAAKSFRRWLDLSSSR
ncbi:anthranilate phosphoribosyltransferase [Paenibacillus turpanensis]|uniref:anthranilate phosphoribosyltransferase n=1 Tax=Paenibacillus turpanensis TaxID=2689078 RepID=UPI001409A195|nr:anthranilate phosphoribosyltransferase [Paenibacillus turpanensis]